MSFYLDILTNGKINLFYNIMLALLSRCWIFFLAILSFYIIIKKSVFLFIYQKTKGLNWYFHKASLLFCKVGKHIFYLEMVSSSCYLRNKKDAAGEHARKN